MMIVRRFNINPLSFSGFSPDWRIFSSISDPCENCGMRGGTSVSTPLCDRLPLADAEKEGRKSGLDADTVPLVSEKFFISLSYATNEPQRRFRHL